MIFWFFYAIVLIVINTKNINYGGRFMTFCEQLNKYIEQVDCTSQELVNASGLSSTVISRYRNGDRSPRIKSKQLKQLADGLYKISCDKKINISYEDIYNTLSTALNDVSIDFEQLILLNYLVLLVMMLLLFLKFVLEI